VVAERENNLLKKDKKFLNKKIKMKKRKMHIRRF